MPSWSEIITDVNLYSNVAVELDKKTRRVFEQNTFYHRTKCYCVLFWMAGKLSEYSKLTDWDEEQVLSMISSFLKKNKSAKMGDFASLFSGHLSRKQIRVYIEKLVERGMLSYAGDGKMRTYSLSKKYENEMALITKAVQIGLDRIAEQTKGQKLDQ